MSNLLVEVQIFQELKRRYAEAFDLDIEDPAIVDTASGECQLEEVIAAVLRQAIYAEAQAGGMDKPISDAKARKERLVNKAAKLRAAAKWAMTEAGLTKLTPPDLTVTLRAGQPPLILTRGADVTDMFATAVTTAQWDKGEIREALNNGAALDFAFLGNPEPVLTIRSK